MLARWVWQRTARPPARRIGRYLALGLVGCFVAGHLDPRVGRGALRRAGDLVHPLPAALLPAPGLAAAGAARPRRSAPGARAQRSSPRSAGARPASCSTRSRPLRCAPRRPLLNVLLVVIDAMRADALAPEVRAAAERVRPRRDPLRPALQRRQLVAGRHVLPLLRPARDLLGRLRRLRPAAGGDGPVPPARLPARPLRQLAGVPRSSGSTGRPWPASRTCASRRARPIRGRAGGTEP